MKLKRQNILKALESAGIDSKELATISKTLLNSDNERVKQKELNDIRRFIAEEEGIKDAKELLRTINPAVLTQVVLKIQELQRRLNLDKAEIGDKSNDEE